MITSILHPSERLKLLRESLGLSQRELAKEFMVSSGAIASWELGSNPVPGPINRLIDLYEQSHVSSESDHNKMMKELKNLLESLKIHDEQLNVIQSNLNVYFKDLAYLNSLHAKSKYAIAKNLINFLSGSKGLTIKAAQLASYMEMGLPAEIRQALGNLQSNLKPMPKKSLELAIESSYNKKIGDVFLYFDYKPIAVTSLAQVHHAKLKSGEEVAVKVQTPDLKNILNKQLKRLNFLGKVGGLYDKDILILVEEIKRAILEECDYKKEILNQEKIGQILKDFPRVIVPKVYHNYCKDNIIVSEFIHGENFLNFSKRAGQASRNIVGEALIRSLSHLAFSHHVVLADIHAENFLVKNDKIVLLDFGRITNPNYERMKYETMFFRAFIMDQKELARGLAERAGYANDNSNFDFDEFWSFFKVSQIHLLKNDKYKFTRNHLAIISREGRRFAQKKMLKFSPEAFWGFAFSSGTWSLCADLEAECNWHQIGLDSFNEALS